MHLFVSEARHLIRGSEANQAVEELLRWIKHQRSMSPNNLDRVAFCFPRIQQEGAEGWQGGSVFLAAAVVTARDPDARLSHVCKPKIYGDKHSIPSVVVWLNGIEDIEYYVSRQNLERLL